MTLDFVDAVPDDAWDFTPSPPRFGPFCRQLRHVIRVRGVYNAAMTSKKADFSRMREYYSGPLTREALRAALQESDRQFLATLETLDADVPIDFSGTLLAFENFVCEVVQHESIHHGQWSLYASLGGFETPLSWRKGWKL